ncbi:MAG TPA: sulfotransferase family 2 domain-containing protein [Candidatus Sulfotelmatobacter sp.]|nr:sulfotransferase family 2 domain-containing protein [Candidatus Sulfotelmatobacter sp.]
MPVSHGYQFIFIHIPKTAGSSMLQALHTEDAAWEFLNQNAWPRFFESPNGVEMFRDMRGFFALNQISHFMEQHLPARILRQMVPAEVWSNYFKFAFVRNPWDLVVSTYVYFHEIFKQYPETAKTAADIAFISTNVDFSNYVRARPYFASEPGYLPFITDKRGELIVDFVGRVETVDADMAEIGRRIGREIALPHLNRLPRANYREYYTPHTRELVAREFAREIEMFGYEF